MSPDNQELREALETSKNLIVSALANQPKNDKDCREHLLRAKQAVEKALNPDAKPLRVCDVNTLESLSDFVVKSVLASDSLKASLDCYRSLVEASIRTALRVAYEPANRN